MAKATVVEINKAKIVFYPIKGIRTIMLNVMCKGGSWYEKGPNYGAFHLLEHLLFQGTKNLPSHEDIEFYKQNHGISNNAWTGGRSIGFWFKFPDISFKEGLNLFEEIVFNPLIPQDLINKELPVIDQEYRDKWDSPIARFDQILLENLIGKTHIFCRNGLGQPEFLRSVKIEDLRQLHQDFYQPQNMIISVVGNFDKNDIKKELTSILEKYSNTSPINTTWPLTQPQQKYLGYQDNVNQSYVVINWFLSHDKKFDLKTEYGLNMFNYILGVGPSSLLFRKIRQELGLVYNIKSRSWAYPNANFFEIWASVDTKNVNLLTENIKNILKDFLSQPIPEELFLKTRYYMDLQTLMSYDSIYNIGDIVTGDLFYDQKIFSPEEKNKIAKSVNPEDIREILNSHLDWNNAYVSVMSPRS